MGGSTLYKALSIGLALSLFILVFHGCDSAFIDDMDQPIDLDGDSDWVDFNSDEDGDVDDTDQDEDFATVQRFYFTQAVGTVGQELNTSILFENPEEITAQLHLDEPGIPTYGFDWGDPRIIPQRIEFNREKPSFDAIELLLAVGVRTGTHEIRMRMTHNGRYIDAIGTMFVNPSEP